MFDPDLFRAHALSFLGLPYIWGGDDPVRGFDCSGLAQEILAAFGADPSGDQTAQGLLNYFIGHGTFGTPQLGALAFYGQSRTAITHVAVCLDSNTVIEAGGGGSKTLTEADAAKQNAYVRLRPVKHRKDFIGCVMPIYP